MNSTPLVKQRTPPKTPNLYVRNRSGNPHIWVRVEINWIRHLTNSKGVIDLSDFVNNKIYSLMINGDVFPLSGKHRIKKNEFIWIYVNGIDPFSDKVSGKTKTKVWITLRPHAPEKTSLIKKGNGDIKNILQILQKHPKTNTVITSDNTLTLPA
jgi:hypothetical protein